MGYLRKFCFQYATIFLKNGNLVAQSVVKFNVSNR